VIRTTSSRLLTLLVALGYGVTVSSVAKHYTRIGILTFVYFVSAAIYMSAYYLNHYAPLSKGLLVVVSVPVAFANTVFFYWIIFSLRANIIILESRNQNIKLKIIRKFTISLIIALALCGLAVILQIIIKFMGDRDYFWKVLWFMDTVWLFLFTAFIIWIMYLMRPTSYTKMLAYHEELQEETMSDHPHDSMEMTARESVAGTERAADLERKNQHEELKEEEFEAHEGEPLDEDDSDNK